MWITFGGSLLFFGSPSVGSRALLLTALRLPPWFPLFFNSLRLPLLRPLVSALFPPAPPSVSPARHSLPTLKEPLPSLVCLLFETLRLPLLRPLVSAYSRTLHPVGVTRSAFLTGFSRAQLFASLRSATKHTFCAIGTSTNIEL